MKWAPTIFGARQLVLHKHILVNGKVVSKPSYLLNPQDCVELVPAMRQHKIVADAMNLQERSVPHYIENSDMGLKGKLIKVPSFEEVPYPQEAAIDVHLIIEYYSQRI